MTSAPTARSRERFVESFDGTRLYTERSGSGAPVVLCDGLGCDGFVWRQTRPRLEQGYDVLHWHYRGHGLSQAPASLSAMRIRDLTDDLRAVLDAHDIERAVLVGHSLGVQVILEFALRHPERVAGLVTVCGSYGTPLETFHNRGYLAVAFPTLAALVERYPREAQRLWTGVVSSELAYQVGLRTEVNQDLVRRTDFEPYFAHLASMDVQVFMALLEDANQHSVERELDTLAVPTLVIAGSRDSFTPPWLSERMARRIPGAARRRFAIRRAVLLLLRARGSRRRFPRSGLLRSGWSGVA